MIVYHGSTLEIKNPDTSKSKKYLDFGAGFYVTTLKNQAEKWALRKKTFSNKTCKAIVNIYEIDDLTDCKYLKFDSYNKNWLEFISKCRKGEDIYKNYDIVEGAVADDDVFKSVDMFFKGIWNVERTLEELKFYKESNQICFVNQNVLNSKLHFKESYEVKNG